VKRSSLVLLLLLAVGCGPPPAAVAGTYAGSSAISVATGESGGGAEFVTIVQNGSELSFTVAGCPLKAFASSATTFAVDGFKCTVTLTGASWALDVTEGTVSANADSIILNAKGRAKSGTRDEQLTFGFNGSKR
jgi:hypothetical protein